MKEMTELKFKLVTQPAEHGSTRTFIAANGGDDDGLFIAEVFGGYTEFLVRAANAHDALVAACEAARSLANGMQSRELLSQIDAALALAGKAQP